MKNIKAFEKEIVKIKDKLMKLGDMHPGSLSKQYNTCGTPGCKCKDRQNPKKHGPYYQISFVHKKRSTSRFVKKEFVREIKRQINNYQKFKQLVEEWKIVATELAQLKFAEKNKLLKEKLGKLRQKTL
jgi:hypothetical protein